MHRHKVLARIFLFLSIVNFTLAGLAQTPKMHEVREDPVPGAENVAGASEELPQLPGRPSTARPSHASVDDIASTTAMPSHARADDIVSTVSEPKPSIAEDLEKDKFFSPELIRRMKEYLILGSLAGLFIGVANGSQKEIMGTVSPGAQTVGRRAVEHSNKRSEDQEDPLSRSLSGMTDEHLRMLSMMSRRMLNSFDQESGS